MSKEAPWVDFDNVLFSDAIQVFLTIYNLKQLSEKTGVSERLLRSARRGESPSLETFLSVCNTFSLSAEYYFTHSEARVPNALAFKEIALRISDLSYKNKKKLDEILSELIVLEKKIFESGYDREYLKQQVEKGDKAVVLHLEVYQVIQDLIEKIRNE